MATGPGVPAIELSAADVLRFRATASHLDRRLAPGAYAAAAWGGLQDSIPRAGLTSLHARVESTAPDAWEDPSLVQIWFRGGADYRDDPFTRYDGDLLVPDPARRRDVLPPVGVSPGHIPGTILVGGQIAGAWQRQRGRIRLRPFLALAAEDRAAVELEARTMPVPGVREPDVAWEPPAL